MPAYNTNLLNPFATNPTNLGASLSALSGTSSNFHAVLNSLGTISGKQVVGLAFNKNTTLNNSLTSLSAATGNVFKVDTSYNGTEMAFILADNSTTQFTCITAKASNYTTKSQLLSAITFDGSVWPEKQRLWNLNG